MVKISTARIPAFVKAPDPKVRAVLIYGPDRGLARERLDALTRTVVEDIADPFRVADLTAASLREDPARLADEAAAQSLMGGRRVVRLTDAGDAQTSAIQAFLETSPGDALVLVMAGELRPSSSLRKLFEGAKNAAALACYADEGMSLEQVVRETLGAQGMTVGHDALSYLLTHLGGDRLLTRSELEKLATYKGTPGEITLEEAAACVGDSAALGLDDLAMAVADGDDPKAQRVLDRLLREGTGPIPVLRAMVRHFTRLHQATGAVAGGLSPDQAVKSLRPPVIFKHTDRIKAQVRRWDSARVGQALTVLLEAEGDCKSSGGPPPEVICSRTLMRLAQAARSGAARSGSARTGPARSDGRR